MATKYWEDQIQKTRDQGVQRGNDIDTQLGQTIGGYRDWGNTYRTDANDALDRLRQNPGYTDSEAGQIGGQAGIDALKNTDYGSNYLTGDEQSAISGDPYKSLSAYNPQMLNDLNQNEYNTVTGTIQGGVGKMRADSDQMANKLDDAAGSQGLKMSSGYRDANSDILNTTAGGYDKAIDADQLGLSSDYQKDYNWTDKDSADLEGQAQSNVAARNSSANDEVARQAAADGNTSPAALAAIKDRNNIQAGVAGADAMTDARVKAKQMGLGVAQGKESTRLGAAQDLSSRRMSATGAMGNMALGANTQEEQMRLGSEQDIASRRMSAAGQEGQMSERIGEYGTTAASGAAERMGAQGIGLEQWNQSQQAQGLQSGEQQEAARAAALAGNRQTVNQQNQTNQFNRGYQLNQTEAQRAQTIADARRTGEQQYLQGVTGQQQQAQTGQLTTQGQQISNYGTQQGAANTANGQGSNYSMWQQGQPGVASQVAAGALGFLGAFEDGGVVGPEGVVEGDGLPTDGSPGDSANETKDPFGARIKAALSRYRTMGSSPSGDSGSKPSSGGSPKMAEASQLGSLAGGAAANLATLFEDGGTAGGELGLVGERNPEIVMDPKNPANSRMVTKPTLAKLGDKGKEVVIPLKGGKDAKIRPSMALPAVRAMQQRAGMQARPFAAGGVINPGDLMGQVKSRYRHPTGPSGPHGPSRILEPLKPSLAYR